MADLERIRGIRCSLVVGEILTEIMQEVMEKSKHNPIKFCNLAFHSPTFKKRLTNVELKVMQTLQTDGYRKLDINIMYKIAKYFKMFYVEPTQTWKGRPNPDNISIGDDMQRIKRARDFYGHNICPALKEEQMEEFFGTFGEVGMRADKYLSKTADCSFKTRILNYKHCPLENETSKQVLKGNDELKNCVICQISLKSGVDLKVVCDEETRKEIKIECSNHDKDDCIQIQIYLEGIKDPKQATAMINIKKDIINNQSIGIKLDEALYGSVVLHVLVKQDILQDDALFLHEIETFIRLLEQEANLEYNSERQCYLIITAVEELFDIESSSEEEENYTDIDDVETEKENIILNIHVKKEVLDNDDLTKDSLSDFMKVLGDELNGVEVNDKQEMKAFLQLKKESLHLTSKSAICTVCEVRHIYRQSTVWCIECEQALCTECRECHATLRASKNHATIPITDNQALAPFISPVGGSVRPEETPNNLSLVKQKVLKDQLVYSTRIQDIKLNRTQIITANIHGILGCNLLSNGNIIFYDNSGTRLVVTDTEGKRLYTVTVQPYYVFDVACISDTTVAVTTGNDSPHGIAIINICSRKILKFICKNYCCYGLTLVNGFLVYCAQGKGIEMMDVNGEKTITIVECDLPPGSSIASYNDQLYYTNRCTNTVTCCDMEGNQIWTFKDDTILRTSIGLSVDNKGHVYVISVCGNNLIVLSADGQQNRQILSEKDGLHNPMALRYDEKRNRLLVANFDSTGFRYEVSY